MYTIDIMPGGAYITITLTGDVDGPSMLPIIQEAHRLGRTQDIVCYLVDGTLSRNVAPMSDAYNFAYRSMPEIGGLDPRAKVALLVAPHDHSHDFVETVSQNAGYHVKLFRDRAQALAYLLGTPRD